MLTQSINSANSSIKVDVVRDRGVTARLVAGGRIENVYRLQIMNATEAAQRYKITVNGLPGLELKSESVLFVESTQARWVPVRVQAPYDAAAPGSHPIHFEIDALDSVGHLSEKSAFLLPR